MSKDTVVQECPPPEPGNVCRECFYEAGLAPRGMATHGTCCICLKNHKTDMIHATTQDELRLIMERVSSAYHNPDYTGPRARKKVLQAIEARYEPADLDDHVHELKSREASDINNAGIDEQVKYLLDAGGLQWVIETFLGGDQ
jgi:hypothetical protein